MTASICVQADPRVADWFLMSSPVPTVVICGVYLLVVRIIGPLLMRDREPFSLKYPMLAYNLFQVLFNGWIFLGECVMCDVTLCDQSWELTYEPPPSSASDLQH